MKNVKTWYSLGAWDDLLVKISFSIRCRIKYLDQKRELKEDLTGPQRFFVIFYWSCQIFIAAKETLF